jgi:hypothetical protein
MASSGWAQGMIAHVWSGGPRDEYLLIDPASGVSADGALVSTRYNDFSNLRWLGYRQGTTPLFREDHVGQWYCIEAHAKLNTPGQSDGVFEYWIDDRLQARKESVNWHGEWNEGQGTYMINAVLFENYWNAGSPVDQERYFDNIVISTHRVGCGCGDDSDQDEIPDAVEEQSSVYEVGVDDRLVDSDDDGMSNTAEFKAGTDPGDAASVLAISRVEVMEAEVTICFRSVRQRDYALEETVDLGDPDWKALAESETSGDGMVRCLQFPNTGQATTYYRVVVR